MYWPLSITELALRSLIALSARPIFDLTSLCRPLPHKIDMITSPQYSKLLISSIIECSNYQNINQLYIKKLYIWNFDSLFYKNRFEINIK